MYFEITFNRIFGHMNVFLMAEVLVGFISIGFSNVQDANLCLFFIVVNSILYQVTSNTYSLQIKPTLSQSL